MEPDAKGRSNDCSLEEWERMVLAHSNGSIGQARETVGFDTDGNSS